VQVVGDDALVTDAARVRRAAAEGWVDTLLMKPNQAGTLSGALAAWDAARGLGMGGIASARSGETEDTTIVHLALGWGLPQLKVGSIARGERTAKWNEVLRIEEATGAPLAQPFTSGRPPSRPGLVENRSGRAATTGDGVAVDGHGAR